MKPDLLSGCLQDACLCSRPFLHTHGAPAHSFLTPLLIISVYPRRPFTVHTTPGSNTAHTPVPVVSSHQTPKLSTSSTLHPCSQSQDILYPCLLYHTLCFPGYGCPLTSVPCLVPAYSFVWMASAECLPGSLGSFHPPTSGDLHLAPPPLWSCPSSSH